MVGDALANLLSHMGYAVTREYYVNDAGAQVDTLARSVHARYREACGETIGAIPEGLYPGDYLVPVGEALAARDGRRWLEEPESIWLPEIRRFATDAMMDLVRADLEALGVRHDLFRSERALVGEGRVDDAYAALEGSDLIYRGVLEPPKGKRDEDWSRANRVSSAPPSSATIRTGHSENRTAPGTYFATDIAYHRDKMERGFTDLIDVWGADHGGYVKRMKGCCISAFRRFGEPRREDLSDGEVARRRRAGSDVERSGRFVTLRDVVDEVGRDVVRFIMLTRRNDAPLESISTGLPSSRGTILSSTFSMPMPGRARRCAAGRRSCPSPSLRPPLSPASTSRAWDDPAELDLIRLLCQWPRVLAGAALTHEPHRIAFYLHDLAAPFICSGPGVRTTRGFASSMASGLRRHAPGSH